VSRVDHSSDHLAVRVVRGAVIALALVYPVLAAYAGLRVLALHVEHGQGNDVLEAGGGFTLAMLWVAMIVFGYLLSGAVVFASWRWVAHRPARILACVVLSCLAVVAVVLALSWGWDASAIESGL